MEQKSEVVGPRLPNVFLAEDGSVAIQFMTTDGLMNNIYELVRIGPVLAKMSFTKGQVISGMSFQNIWSDLIWYELSGAVKYA